MRQPFASESTEKAQLALRPKTRHGLRPCTLYAIELSALSYRLRVILIFPLTNAISLLY